MPDCQCKWLKDRFMDQRTTIDQLRNSIGQEIGVSDWFLIDQNRINQFADCTEDHQWIHVDVERATRGPFGKTIAHGFLTLALIPAMSKCIQFPLDDAIVQMSLTLPSPVNDGGGSIIKCICLRRENAYDTSWFAHGVL